MKTITITTKRPNEVVDITEAVEQCLPKGKCLCHVFVKHTTAAVTTADLDPGTDLDMLDAFAFMVPKLHYRHPHDPGHVGDHIMSSMVGPHVLVPAKGGQLVLGVWQRVVLVELDGPRERELVITCIPAKS